MDKIPIWKRKKSGPNQPEQTLPRKLKEGLELGNTTKIQKYLEKHPYDVNKKFSWNQHPEELVYPLQIASKGKLVHVITKLIEMNADVNCVTESGKNALHFTALSPSCNCSIVDELINRGTAINHKDGLGNTPIMVAVQKNNVGVVRKLIDNFADSSISNISEETPLQVARYNKNTTIIGLLTKNEDTKGKKEEMEIKFMEMQNNYHLELQKNQLELSRSNDTIHMLVKLMNQPGCRNSFSGYPDSGRCTSLNSLLDNDLDVSRSRNSWVLPQTPTVHGLQVHDLQRENLVHEQDNRLRAEHLLDDESENQPVGKSEKFNIQRYYQTFLTMMKPDDILIGLYEKCVITTEQKQLIQSITVTSKKNDEILSLVLHGTKGNLRVLLDLLVKTKQSHLANIIQGSNGRILYSNNTYTRMQQPQLRKYIQSEPDIPRKDFAGTHV